MPPVSVGVRPCLRPAGLTEEGDSNRLARRSVSVGNGGSKLTGGKRSHASVENGKSSLKGYIQSNDFGYSTTLRTINTSALMCPLLHSFEEPKPREAYMIHAFHSQNISKPWSHRPSPHNHNISSTLLSNFEVIFFTCHASMHDISRNIFNR